MGLEIQNLGLKVLNHGLGCGSGVFSGEGSNKPVVRKVRITVNRFRQKREKKSTTSKLKFKDSVERSSTLLETTKLGGALYMLC